MPSFNPNTDALDRIVLSMKLKLYVMNMIGMSRQSSLRTTRFASAVSTVAGNSSTASLESLNELASASMIAVVLVVMGEGNPALELLRGSHKQQAPSPRRTRIWDRYGDRQPSLIVPVTSCDG